MIAHNKSIGEIEWSLYFGRNLQRMLKIKGIRQQDLARELGVTEAMVSRYVNGISLPSVYKVCHIANIIGCQINDLIKNEYED